MSNPYTAQKVTPRIIIHGGAGNITRANLPDAAYTAYRAALLRILSLASAKLNEPDATAIDIATYAVSLLEDEPLFNAGKGAVFTRAGTTELESSIMVSNGYRKRGVGCMLLSHVKNPIKLAREMLVRGEEIGGGGAQGHSQLSGEYAEKLAREWGLEMVDPAYFFTQRRWDEHMRGLEREEMKLKDGSSIQQFSEPFPDSEESASRPQEQNNVFEELDPRHEEQITVADELDRRHEEKNNVFEELDPRHEEQITVVEEGGSRHGGENNVIEQNHSLLDNDWIPEYHKNLHEQHHPITNTMDTSASWDGTTYLPQGTVGAVVLDSTGTLCVATSTGGLTNKLPGRIGDTPTLGAGFWAEEWFEDTPPPQPSHVAKPKVMSKPQPARSQIPRPQMLYQPSRGVKDMVSRGDLTGLLGSCLPSASGSKTQNRKTAVEKKPVQEKQKIDEVPTTHPPQPTRHAVALSGTGNGDSFLRLSAVRTAAAISRFVPTSLASAVSRVVGRDGELQRSAGPRWGVTGEGEGGMIGIEIVGNEGKVVWDFNCGGMFRAWVDDVGGMRCEVFREGE